MRFSNGSIGVTWGHIKAAFSKDETMAAALAIEYGVKPWKFADLLHPDLVKAADRLLADFKIAEAQTLRPQPRNRKASRPRISTRQPRLILVVWTPRSEAERSLEERASAVAGHATASAAAVNPGCFRSRSPAVHAAEPTGSADHAQACEGFHAASRCTGHTQPRCLQVAAHSIALRHSRAPRLEGLRTVGVPRRLVSVPYIVLAFMGRDTPCLMSARGRTESFFTFRDLDVDRRGHTIPGPFRGTEITRHRY